MSLFWPLTSAPAGTIESCRHEEHDATVLRDERLTPFTKNRRYVLYTVVEDDGVSAFEGDEPSVAADAGMTAVSRVPDCVRTFKRHLLTGPVEHVHVARMISIGRHQAGSRS